MRSLIAGLACLLGGYTVYVGASVLAGALVTSPLPLDVRFVAVSALIGVIYVALLVTVLGPINLWVLLPLVRWWQRRGWSA